MRQPTNYHCDHSRHRTQKLKEAHPELTYAAIAEQLGISKPTVWRHLHRQSTCCGTAAPQQSSLEATSREAWGGKWRLRLVPRPYKSRFWTDAEIAYLEASAEIIPKAEIARKVNRTERAVQTKLFRLGLYTRTTLDNYSAKYVAENLGLKRSRLVVRWITRGLLKATKGKCFWQIRAVDFANFCRENPEIIRHFDRQSTCCCTAAPQQSSLEATSREAWGGKWRLRQDIVNWLSRGRH